MESAMRTWPDLCYAFANQNGCGRCATERKIIYRLRRQVVLGVIEGLERRVPQTRLWQEFDHRTILQSSSFSRCTRSQGRAPVLGCRMVFARLILKVVITCSYVLLKRTSPLVSSLTHILEMTPCRAHSSSVSQATRTKWSESKRNRAECDDPTEQNA
jgi:hypothetical protein